MVQAVNYGVSTRRPGSGLGSVRVRDKVELEQGLLRVLPYSPVSIIPPWLSIVIYHLRDEQ
jgi:hypothetical protein